MIVVAGPCILEDEKSPFEIARELKRQLAGLPIEFFFKASFDKANRTSIDGYRGPGLREGVALLAAIKKEVGVPVLTDVHEQAQCDAVAEHVDALQIPAFLCRQTDLVLAAASACQKHSRWLNVKKGQFLAPEDALHIVRKIESAWPEVLTHARSKLTLTERGVSFGYRQLVVDMTSFQTMKSFGVRTIFDATHSVQMPGAGADGKSTGGRRDRIEVLGRAAVAAGADGIFLECHPNPSQAKSDGPNAFPLEHVGAWIRQLLSIRNCVKDLPRLL